MRLTRRKDLPGGFFNPGLAEPFVSFQPSRSIEKILRFMIPVQHAGWRYGDLILDLGVGYAWTTEWLGKLGFHPVGVDLNRDYLRVGMRRTGGSSLRFSSPTRKTFPSGGRRSTAPCSSTRSIISPPGKPP